MYKKIKILHGFVNYGTQSGILAKTLRELGYQSKSITYYDSFNRTTDKVIHTFNNVIIKNVIRPFRLIQRIVWFFKYDVFHYYYGASLFPIHFDFYIYRLFNKKVICHYLGNDVQGYWDSVKKYKWTNMPGYIGNNNPTKYDNTIQKRLKIENKYSDLQIVCAPLYYEFVKNSLILPLAVDLEHFHFLKNNIQKRFVVMHAPTNRGFKGTNYIVSAINQLKNEGYDFDFNLVENVTHEELKIHYQNCNIFIDQIMCGWYGTAAIEAMAIGRPVICSIRESYLNYIDYGNKIPIIHADPDNIYNAIKNILDNKDIVIKLGKDSRLFVEEIHDRFIVTKKLLNYYKSVGICVE